MGILSRLYQLDICYLLALCVLGIRGYLMSEIADDIINGLCWGIYFFENNKTVEHGYPVLCWDCHEDGSEIPRAEVGDD